MKKNNICGFAVKKIIAQKNIRSDGDRLYFYNESFGAWIKYDAKQARRKIQEVLKEEFIDYEFRLAEIKMIEAELLESLDIFLDFKTINNEKLLNCRNGMINLETLEIISHNKDFYETTCLDFNFNSRFTWDDVPNWTQYIETSLDANPLDSKVKLLLQILVYVTSNLRGAKKMFILLGKPHSGKSRIIKFIERITDIGGNMPLTLSDLSDRFRSGLLENSRLVLNDELPCVGLKNLDLLKKIIAEENIIIECKGKDPKKFSPKIKLLFAGNQLPNTQEYDFGNAFAERLCVLFYPTTLERKVWNLNLDECLYRERDAIMSLALKEAKELITSNLNFSEPDDSVKILDGYKKENASVQAFVEDEDYCQFGQEYKEHTSKLYEAYVKYAKDNLLLPASRRDFRQQLLLIQGIVSMDTKFRLPGSTLRAGVSGIQLKRAISY